MSEGGYMLERNVTAGICGVGAMGSMCARLLLEKGVELVGAVSRESHLGEDLGDAIGLGRSLGVPVVDDPALAFGETGPDIVVVATSTYLEDVFEPIVACIRCGANVITTSEELLYSWRTQPVRTAKLHELARLHGVTVVGSGYNDYFWGGEVTQLAGCCQHLDRLEGVGQFNIDDYGPQVARNSHIGESVTEFATAFSGTSGPPAYLQTVADLICADLGLTICVLRENVRPATEAVTLPCTALGLEVKPGDVTGKVTEVDVTTEEGAELHLELRERLYLEGETDLNRWVLHGTPDIVLENPSPATDVLTCATIVNRVPDVLNAPAGYVTVDRLPRLRYASRPLHFSVDPAALAAKSAAAADRPEE
jgi:2,4-diaminopentanoate dehydrogenase